MSKLHDDYLLWFGITIAGLTTLYTAYHTINHLEAAKETHLPVKSLCIVSQDTEDEIDTTSLAKLTAHPSASIRESATKILVSRAARSKDLIDSVYAESNPANPDAAQQQRACTLMRLIMKYVPDAFNPPPPPDGTGWEEMMAARSYLEEEAGDDEEEGEASDASTTGASADGHGEAQVPARPRLRDGSPEELARRRRRREAIVLHEGDRPLTQEDIIQRRRTE